MLFIWDEAKRRINLRKHGIDFVDAEQIVVSIAHAERDEEIRIISIRKATKREAHFYFSQVVDQAI